MTLARDVEFLDSLLDLARRKTLQKKASLEAQAAKAR